VIHRAMVLCDGPVLEASSFELADSWSPPAVGRAASLATMENAIYEFECQYLSDLLSEQNGNVTNAAKVAGKDRRTFQRLLRRHGITRQDRFSRSARRLSLGACGVFAASSHIA